MLKALACRFQTEIFILIGHLVAEIILNVKVQEISNSGNNFLFIFLSFFLDLIAVVAKIEKKNMERGDEVMVVVVLCIWIEHLKS